MSTKDNTVPDGGCNASNPCSAEHAATLAWLAAAEAWLTVPSQPNYQKARAAISNAWWHCAEAGETAAARERQRGRKTLHGVDTPKAAAVDG